MEKSKIITLKQSIIYFKRFLILTKPYWIKIIKGLCLGVVTAIIGMLTPIFTKILVDKVYPTENISLMHVIVITILGITLGSTIINAFMTYYNTVITTHLGNSTILMFFNHLLHFKIRFYDEHRVGEVISRFADISNSLKTVNSLFQTVLANGIYVIIIPPLLFIIHWKLALISMITFPITIVTISISGRIIRNYWNKSVKSFAEINAYQVESLSNIQLIKSFVLERYVYEKTKKQIEEAINNQIKANLMSQLVGISSNIAYIFNTSLFIWFGWTFILSKEMSLGDYLVFSTYINYLYNPISNFVNLLSEFQQTAISLNRFYEYIDMLPEINPVQVFNEPKPIRDVITGNIEIKGVSFAYNKHDTVLNDLDMCIIKGKITTIVGPSGSGKTTLLRIILGMENITDGDIYYDGKSISKYDIQDIRRQISVVWQEFGIIKGTIWDNIVLDVNDVSEQKVKEIIKICKLEEFIEKLPDGYETVLSERGSTLSGGQRQRIAIARALIRNTPILIIDEATSNIDRGMEEELLKELYEYQAGKTIITVTHRMTVNYLSDNIYVFNSGNIICHGTHKELMDTSELYRKMLKMPS
jgi:ABC-type bacteriocin/lantibiotic exporter with double-glycine peptidase domain